MNKSILWSTVEAICWAKDFNYEEYKEYHAQYFPEGSAESPELYAALVMALDADMERDMLKDTA